MNPPRSDWPSLPRDIGISRRQVLKDLCGSGLGLLIPTLGTLACDEATATADSGSAGRSGDLPLDPGGGSTPHNGGSNSGAGNGNPFGGQPAGGTATRSPYGSDTAARGGASPLRSAPGGATHGSFNSANAGEGTDQDNIGGRPAVATRSANQTGGVSSAKSSGAQAVGGAGRATMPSAGSAGSLNPAMFDDAASCTLTTTDIEGPFFIDEDEFPNDIGLVRSDIRERLVGCEFRLHFRLLNARQACSPISNAEIYIWHCNADGYYSGFNGQDPSRPYDGAADRTPDNMERFCRGIQSTDTAGVASFVTIYPGWYAGRPIHVHLMARLSGTKTRLITTQLYFPADFTLAVHQSEPAYQARASAMPAGSRNPPAGNPTIPTLTHSAGLVTGVLNVIVNGA